MSISKRNRRRSALGRESRRASKGDGGSSLVLAIVFLTVVSVVMIALVDWVGNDLRNTANFTAAQSFQSTANSASQVALQTVRYNFMAQTLNASPPAPCWTALPTPSLFLLNGQSVDSWCTTSWTVGTDQGRVVTISTCLSSVSATNCAQSPLLQAIVSLGDFQRGYGFATCGLDPRSWVTCGTTMTINTWAFGVSPPAVTSLTTGSISCPVGSPVNIRGTNLTGTSSVNFLFLTPPATISTDEAISASSYTVISSTLITACTPTPGGENAYVEVMTPNGPSALGPTFSY